MQVGSQIDLFVDGMAIRCMICHMRRPTTDETLKPAGFRARPSDINALREEADKKGVSAAQLFNRLLARAGLIAEADFK